MRITYARDVDALAIWFAPGAKTIGAREIAPDTYADFDTAGRLLGIEVLNASGLYDRAELEKLPPPESQSSPKTASPGLRVGNPVTPHPYRRGDESSE